MDEKADHSRAISVPPRSRILGVVLNRAEGQGRHEDHYQYYGYSERGGTEIARL